MLDNCEHLLDAAATLVDALLRRSETLTVVATSREPLGVPGETAWRVPSMPAPDPVHGQAIETLSQFDAVRLFLDRATKVRPNFKLTPDNAPAVAQICHRLEGIPLAVELAAARVRGLTVEQVAGGLDDRFRLLTGGARTVLPRQQTLQASVDWSYELLSERERAVFRRLAVFAGGFTLDAAEQVAVGADIEPVEVLDLLVALVDKSMIDTDDARSRYRMLESLRQYATARLVEAGETTTTRDAHLAWAAQLFDPLDVIASDSINAADALADEIDNFRAAFEWAVLTGDADAATRCFAPLGCWEISHGDPRAGVDVATRAREMPGASHRLKCLALASGAFALAEAGDVEQAARDVDELLAMLGDLDDDARSVCLLAAGEALTFRGELRSRHRAPRGRARRGAPSRSFRGRAHGLRITRARRTSFGASGARRRVRRRGRPPARRHRSPWPTSRTAASTRPTCAAGTTKPGTFIDRHTRGTQSADRREPRAARGCRWISRKAPTPARPTGSERSSPKRAGAASRAPWCSWAGARASGAWCTTTPKRAREQWSPGTKRPHRRGGRSSSSRCSRSTDWPTHATRSRPSATCSGVRRPPRFGRTSTRCSLAWRAMLPPRSSSATTHSSRNHRGDMRPQLVHTLEALSGIAAAQESYVECARLAGAAQALRDEMGYVLRWPYETQLRDADFAAARAALGDDAFDAAFDAGRTLDEDAAVAYAQRARGERKRPSVGWDSLTPTELNVVRLVASGLTNKEVGRELLDGRGDREDAPLARVRQARHPQPRRARHRVRRPLMTSRRGGGRSRRP